MGARRRGGREDSPLAGLLRRSPGGPDRDRGDEPKTPPDVGAVEVTRETGTETRTEGRRGAVGVPRPAQKRRGRPRGGRRSNPDYVQISARIHREVRFSLERVLVERSEREGRYVEMAEVIEDLMRFYVENGDPYEMIGGR